MTRSILILFAHPAYERSRANRALLQAAAGVGGVHIHDLYEAYPDFAIDVPAEQELLRRHELIVWQHPLFWYSVPALMKEWIDQVLEHGFAFGAEGRALEGKWLLSAITTGGTPDSYAPEGGNRYALREFLRPLEQTARLCRMEYLPPYVVCGTHRFDRVADAAGAAAGYARLLADLRDGRISPEDWRGLELLPCGEEPAPFGGRSGS
jgi:glutathione-regulated potassium-efflux system ancillary protein KefG